MPLIQNEWEALKAKLQGITVIDATSGPEGTPVDVFFGIPESELKDQTFPMIVIYPQAPQIDHSREWRGPVKLPYFPEGYTPATNPNFDPTVDVTQSPFIESWIIPLNLDFTITAYSRTQRHALQIMHRLNMGDMLAQRNAFLIIPEDGTTRSLFVIGGPEFVPIRDVENKRLFKTTWVIRVASEQLDGAFDVPSGTPAYVFDTEILDVDTTITDTENGAT